MGMLTLLWVDGKEAILGISTKLLLMLLQGTLFPSGPRLTAMMLRILVSAPTAHDGLNARKRANGFASAKTVTRIFTFKASSLQLQILGDRD